MKKPNDLAIRVIERSCDRRIDFSRIKDVIHISVEDMDQCQDYLLGITLTAEDAQKIIEFLKGETK